MITTKQRRVRLPPDVEDWIKSEAAINERSQNAQIVFIFREAMRRTEKASDHALGKLSDASEQ